MEFGGKFVYLRKKKRAPTAEAATASGDEERIEEEEEKFTVEDLDQGLEKHCSPVVNDDGKTCMLDILDSAGQEEFSTMREQYVNQGNCFMIVYAIDDRKTYEEALSIYHWILHMRCVDKMPTVLCGNKSDLVDLREVSTQEAKEQAKAHNMVFFETSAKTGDNVVESFHALVRCTPRQGPTYKAIVLGAGGVGKSAITIRFVSDTFVSDYDPTIEDTYMKQVVVDNIPEQMLKNEQPAPNEPRASTGSLGKTLMSMLGIHNKQDSPQQQQQQQQQQYQQQQVPPPELPPRTNRKGPKKDVTYRKADANVVLLSLGTLENEPTIVTGDPIRCSECQSVLSHISKLDQEVGEDGDNSQQWTCEFCSHINTGLDVAEQEIPKEKSVDFLLAAAPDKAATGGAEASIAGTVIYCIDTSGSMACSLTVSNLQAQWNIMQGMQGTEPQHVQRLDCMKMAVKRQLERYALEDPKKKVILVTFSHDVKVHGDGSLAPITVAGADKLNNLAALLNEGQSLATLLNIQELGVTAEGLLSKVEGLNVGGSTALGPALAVSLGLLAKQPGSEIILCTDGLPNTGIGSLQGSNQDSSFYIEAGHIADGQQTTISIIGIETNEHCAFELVSNCVSISSGTVNILNPQELTRQIRQLGQDRVVATNVEVTLMLHPSLQFDPDTEGPEVAQRSKISKNFGNVQQSTDLTFSFQLRPEQVDQDLLKVPFQVQIKYTKTDGRRFVRIITEERDATADRQQMEEGLNAAVTSVAAMRQAASMAEKNQPENARLHLYSYGRYLQRNADSSSEQKESAMNFFSAAENMDNMLQARSEPQRKMMNYPPGCSAPKSKDKQYSEFRQAQKSNLQAFLPSKEKADQVRGHRSVSSEAVRKQYYNIKSVDMFKKK